MDKLITIEVAYALPDKQQILSLEVEEGISIRDAVRLSALESIFPDLDLASAPLGIFGKAVRSPEQEQVKAGQRIEVYRPLVADPKEARARRAAKAKAQKTAGEN